MSHPFLQATIACVECRRVKMKCRLLDVDQSKCERCTRKTLDCVFRQHRRGRKPGAKISKTKKAQITSPGSAQSHDSPSVATESHILQTEDINSLQPSGLLSHQALQGRFSLGNILNPVQEPLQRQGSSDEPLEDPIELGLITASLAKCLFESFMTVLNPYISQLDPYLHTFSYVRSKSPFLLSAILAMSSKLFNNKLYTALYSHAQDLFTKVFRQGSKSVQVVQAILILTYWKETQDTRVWTSIGYAIRICMDLGWHKLNPCPSTSDGTESQTQIRERRNIERTWYLLFVYDQSLSLQTGRPCMIECSEFLECIESWCNDPLAIENDQLLGAFTTLRLITSVAFPILVSKSQQSSLPDGESVTLVSLLDGRINRWEKTWVKKVTMQKEPSCHEFLIRFYATHLRLQLHTLPLRGILVSSEKIPTHYVDNMWVAYSSALDMLKLISRFPEHICFSQDSIHVMTAYSAAFLVKITATMYELASCQLETNCIEVIQDAARVFSTQSGCTNSSCTLQATFLSRVVQKLQDNQRKRKSPQEERPAGSMGPLWQVSETEGIGTHFHDNSSNQCTLELGTLDTSFLSQEYLDFPFQCDDICADMFGTIGSSTQDIVYFSQPNS